MRLHQRNFAFHAFKLKKKSRVRLQGDAVIAFKFFPELLEKVYRPFHFPCSGSSHYVIIGLRKCLFGWRSRQDRLTAHARKNPEHAEICWTIKKMKKMKRSQFGFKLEIRAYSCLSKLRFDSPRGNYRQDRLK